MKRIIANDGHILMASRWIKLRHNYRPNKRNSLWYYVTDGNGRRELQNGFDPSTGLFLDYFIWNGRKWAVEQFYSAHGTMGMMPIFWEENGEEHRIDGYDSENYCDPILIELSGDAEHVRVYEEVRE